MDQTFQNVVETMKETAHAAGYTEISNGEAAEAAQNMVSFCRTALAIRRRILHDEKHGKNN